MITERTDTYLVTKSYGNTDYFEIIPEFPEECVVWPIGRENFPFEKYVPVAYPIGDFQIDRKRLMAIECKDEETALAILKEAVKRGVDKKKFELLNE